MKLLTRRNFLLNLASVATAPLILSGNEASAQNKNIFLRTPQNKKSFLVNEQVELSVLSRRIYPRLSRIDFKANGQMIGQGTWRNPRINWTPSQTGDYTITAEAFSAHTKGLVGSSTSNLSVNEVLYDKMGSVGNWGFDDGTLSGFYEVSYVDIDEREFATVTIFLGTLPQPKIMKRLEVITDAYNVATNEEISLSTLHTYKIRVWDENIYPFQANGAIGSFSNTEVGVPNFGDINNPVGHKILSSGDPFPLYHVGWDNLNIPLPANVPLQMTVAPAVPNNVRGELHGSIFKGTNMIGATGCGVCVQNNVTLHQPMCAKISVQ